METKHLYTLLRNVQITSTAKGGIILPEESVQKKVYYIKRGVVRSYGISEKGDEVTFQLYAETNFFTNVHAVLFDEPSEFAYQALETCKLYVIDYDAFLKITSKNQILVELNRNYFGKRVIKRAFQRNVSFVFLSPEERYIQFVKENPKLINRVPDKYIANVLGVTPVSLSRIKNRITKKK